MTAEDREMEMLSSLMDGETHDLELRRTLDAVTGDAMRHRWQRYHRVREALRGQFAIRADIDVSEQVRQTLEAKVPTNRNGIWNMAIAATVTLAVVLGGQELLLPSGDGSPIPVLSELGGAVVPVLGAQPVQASLGNKAPSLAYRQPFTTLSSNQNIATVYDRLARDRYRALNERHAAAAAPSHPAPFISYVRVSESQLEANASD